MRNLKFFFFIFLSLSAATISGQGVSLEDRWKKVQSLEEKGLSASAAREVRVILNRATRAGNVPQQLKAVIYTINYNTYQENFEKISLSFLDSQITKSKTPARNILYSLKGSLLSSLYQSNSYKIYSRTRIYGEAGNDPDTWDSYTFHRKISEAYLKSLEKPELLKTTAVGKYEAIIEKGKNTRQLRPTLYDLLAHLALEYLTADEYSMTEPASRFVINDERVFSDPSTFIKIRFNTSDTFSQYLKAVTLLQQLTAFHLNDKNPAALADLNVIRLQFAWQHSHFQNKDQLYESALLNMENDPRLKSFAHRPQSLRARLYFEQGSAYDPVTKKKYKWHFRKAKLLCDSIISSFPESEGGIEARNLRIQITGRELNIQAEKAYVPLKPVKYLIRYKNTGEVFLKAVRITYEQLYDLERNENDALKEQLNTLPSVWSRKVKLSGTDDFMEHSAEGMIDPLEPGIYLLLASADSSFAAVNNILVRQPLCVSSISYLREKNDFYVLNRETGQPLAGARIAIWEEVYKSEERRYVEIKSEESYTTDTNGRFTLAERTQYERIIPDITYNNGRFKPRDQEYAGPGYEPPQSQNLTSWLFTDRSIYRPGQTVFFKGIMVNADNKNRKYEVAKRKKTSVKLRNANYEIVKSLPLESGDFGSYHGSFILPEGILNGQFSLQDSLTGASLYFNVEDYKRPKFMASIADPQGSFRLNDSIKVQGQANTYTGVAVSNAKVAYRVTRRMRLTYPFYYGRMWPPYGGKEMEITNGQTTTDGKGNFSIIFKAIPDESIDRELDPSFRYEISADVTDINGETRSATSSVFVSYKALQLSVECAEKIPADSLSKILIRSTNLQGLHEKSTVSVSVYALNALPRVYRKRYWDDPDMFLMQKSEHDRFFPDDPYDKEYRKENWPVAGRVSITTDSTRADGGFGIPNGDGGWMKLIAAAVDKFGDSVKAEKIIYAYRTKEERVPGEAADIILSKETAEPVSKAGFSIRSNFEKIHAIAKILRADGSRTEMTGQINRQIPMSTELDVNEADRGGINISLIFIMNNRVYREDRSIAVPWTNKDLRITYESFREKVLPGSAEKWKVKISGAKGERIAAELLASMYDASLDQFRPHDWSRLRNLWTSNTNMPEWRSENFNMSQGVHTEFNVDSPYRSYEKIYDRLMSPETRRSFAIRAAAVMVRPEMAADAEAKASEAPLSDKKENAAAEDVKDKTKEAEKPAEKISVRKNLQETAFFFAQLSTDAQGNTEFSFTMPESLTEWKLMLMAYTGDLASAYSERKIVSSKPLMIQANAPRFFREGDHMEVPVKITSTEIKEMTGRASLELFDPATGNSVDGWFKNVFPVQYFTVSKEQSAALSFPIDIPFTYTGALGVRVKATSADSSFSDGEEVMLPVLSNRILVTESQPVYINKEQSRTFRFEKLLDAGKSPTATTMSLTAEFSGNTAWYAVQALPYLAETTFECADEQFNRYYANALASYVANSNPAIRDIYRQWLLKDSSALLSNLDKNQELKSLLLEETPWVQDAKNESAGKRQIAVLLDNERIGSEKRKSIEKLSELQLSNGGFSWFKGGIDDRYITQNILTGIGHLMKLGALGAKDISDLRPMLTKAIEYADRRMKDEYETLKRLKIDLKKNNLSSYAAQYLYMRSFFPDYVPQSESRKVQEYYFQQAETYWLQNRLYMQGMIALAIHRKNNKSAIPKMIISSLKEKAIYNEELGMYWKEMTTSGYYWYQAPIESQALMTEVFSEITGDDAAVNMLRTWLIRNKQTNRWKSSRSTAEACYALLYGLKDLNTSSDNIKLKLGDMVIAPSATEAGSGYFKSVLPGEKVKPEMGKIEVIRDKKSAKGDLPGWGAVYWQYLEDADKVTSAATSLRLTKQIFLEKPSDRGPVLVRLSEGNELSVGDKVKVRIEIRTDRDMEYVHMKDMRASCMEPLNVLSGYRYRGGLGFYESTRDASTQFFFSFLPKGTHVFEYPLVVSQAGDFSNGITTIRCLYAPEFSSHSEGIRISVKQP